MARVCVCNTHTNSCATQTDWLNFTGLGFVPATRAAAQALLPHINFEQVVYVRACHLQLKDVPDWIFNLPNVAEVEVSDNQLATLPAAIGAALRLRVLSAEHNVLTTLPAELANCKRLESLNLTRNRLTAIPPCVLSLQALQRLCLWSNPLARFPYELAALPELDLLFVDQDVPRLFSYPGSLTDCPNDHLRRCRRISLLPTTPLRALAVEYVARGFPPGTHRLPAHIRGECAAIRGGPLWCPCAPGCSIL